MTPKPKRRPRPHRALDETEREEVLGACTDGSSTRRPLRCGLRFWTREPRSIRTMYRILEEHGEVRERRNQRRHPNYTKPELLAEAPNQVWSWESRSFVAPSSGPTTTSTSSSTSSPATWLAGRESAALAQRLIAESCRKGSRHGRSAPDLSAVRRRRSTCFNKSEMLRGRSLNRSRNSFGGA